MTRDTGAGSRGGARTCASPCGACFAGPRRARLRRVRIVLEAVPNVSEGRSPEVDRRDRRGVRRQMRCCSTSTPTPTTTAPSTRSPRRERRPARLPRRRHRRRGGARSTCASTSASIRAWAPPTSSRSSRSHRSRSSELRTRHELSRRASDPSSAFRSSSTASSAPGGGRRSSGAAGSTSSADASRRASSRPSHGPGRIDPRSGAVLVGARHALVAYNLELATDDVEVARAIARAVRESSGGMPGVQALGLRLPSSGRVQVSMNVVDVERAPLHEVVERVRAEALARDVEVAGGRARRARSGARLEGGRGSGRRTPRCGRVAGARASPRL